jgi:hypothetical protein
MKFTCSSRWLLILFALGYGAVMLHLDGQSPRQLYGLSPYHRYQADAFLRGQLHLADSLQAIQPGLVWHDGRVQHVWGLGVGVWLMPFEAIWRLFGGFAFPDRITLGVAFMLLALYSGNTGLKLAHKGHAPLGLALVWMILLCPALWTLSRATRLVFEETIIYAVLLSLATLVSIVRVTLLGSRGDYAFCCALGAFTIWVRPTHAIYGVMAVVICSLIVWTRRRSWKEVMLGTSGLLASFALLAWSNVERFGSPIEFGHRLTVSTESMVYLTRFGNPFGEASMLEAAKELFGLLFLSNPAGAPAFAENQFPGQADFTRWRRLDLTAYDQSYAFLCLVGGMAATVWLWRNRQSQDSLRNSSSCALVAGLLVWSATSMIGLGCFYLYYPAIATRYLLDFSPACTGFMALGWFLLPARFSKFCLPVLAGWLVYEIVSAKVPLTERPANPGELRRSLARLRMDHMSLGDFAGSYSVDQHPTITAITCNGQGWHADAGFAASVVILATDNPEFLELRVGARRGLYGQIARKDSYRAQIDGRWLPLKEIRYVEDEQVLVRFDIPLQIRARRKEEIVFVSFTAGFDEEDRNSVRLLHQVRWR